MNKFLQLLFGFCIGTFLSVTFSYGANTGLIGSIFKLNSSDTALLITNDAFLENSLSGNILKDKTITNDKISGLIDASKFSTGVLSASAIPNSVLSAAGNTKSFSGRTVEETITYDDTKIPTSKAVYEKIKTFLTCPATTSSGYTTTLLANGETKGFQKTVTISNGNYIETQNFTCTDGVLTISGNSIISDLYCNPGYWSNGTTNSCSEVGIGYYSTGGIIRSVCENILTSNSSYSGTTNTTSSCTWGCNENYLLYTPTSICLKKCENAIIGDDCGLMRTDISPNNVYPFVKVSDNLLTTRTDTVKSLGSVAPASSICSSSIGGRTPNETELRTLYSNRSIIGGFDNTVYWTSIYAGQYNPAQGVYFDKYYGLNFSNGVYGTNLAKSPTYVGNVRCVRSI